MKMNKFGAFSIFDFSHMLTPVAIDFMKYAVTPNASLSYKTLFIFGIRIARWRCDQ